MLLRRVLRPDCVLLIVSLFGPAIQRASAELPDEASSIGYVDQIRPILTENCFACHGPDAQSRAADLRLDIRERAVESNVIVPGDPDASEIVDRISRGDDDDLAMPPIDGHKRLTAEQKELLIRWIAQGAGYESHWSLQPPLRYSPPLVKDTDWVRDPIDAFVLRRIEEAGLQPAPQADRRTLARRLSLDLTGLPPTPEAVETFVDDRSPDYYEAYVDRLLQSPAWGEHRGRYWLDYARYGDTHGIHFDNYREIWSYRDWVIGAFNRNLPFDQFSIEQLAGDLLPNPTLDQLIATGFNRCNITTNEGGIIDEEYKVLYARDRTETTSAVWLGLTTGCAVCHDHKFDPITAKDFYALSAFFDNTTQPVRDKNIPDTPPVIVVPPSGERADYVELTTKIQRAEKEVQDAAAVARDRFDHSEETIDADALAASLPHDSLRHHWPLTAGKGPAVLEISDQRVIHRIADQDLAWHPGHAGPYSLQIDDVMVSSPGAGDFNRQQPFTASFWLWVPDKKTRGAAISRMDEKRGHRGWDVYLEADRLSVHLIDHWPENAVKISTRAAVLSPKRWTHVAAVHDGSGTSEGVKIYVDGELQPLRVDKGDLKGDIVTDVPFQLGRRTGGGATKGIRLGDVRLHDTVLDAARVQTLHEKTPAAYWAAKPANKRLAHEKDGLFEYWVDENAPDLLLKRTKHQNLVRTKAEMEERGTIAHVMNEAEGDAKAFILKRGEYDQRGVEVIADTPEVLPAMDPALPRNRLGLAKWLFDDKNPLTARVTVNRFWQEIFGAGLVGSAGDFGVTGSPPTHPELLDRLAIDFRESGWDVRELFRRIVTSSTYRQASVATAQKVEIDPGNELLCRGKRFRMDAEMVRDYALSVSGLLAPTIGGPSVRPYQPPGIWEAVAMPGSDTRDYKIDRGDSVYRRSLYTFWKRSAPPASMDILNAPSREACVVRRDRTNTPLQALVTLNDPQFIEAARALATEVLNQADDLDERVDEISMRLLSRTLQDPEREVVTESIAALIEHFDDEPEQAAKLIAIGNSPVDQTLRPSQLAAWTMLCNQLMNLDEVLNQ